MRHSPSPFWGSHEVWFFFLARRWYFMTPPSHGDWWKNPLVNVHTFWSGKLHPLILLNKNQPENNLSPIFSIVKNMYVYQAFLCTSYDIVWWYGYTVLRCPAAHSPRDNDGSCVSGMEGMVVCPSYTKIYGKYGTSMEHMRNMGGFPSYNWINMDKQSQKI